MASRCFVPIRGAQVIVVPVDYRASEDLLDRIVDVVKARAILVGDEVRISSSSTARTKCWRAVRFADHFGCGQQRVVILAGVRAMSAYGSLEVIIKAHHG